MPENNSLQRFQDLLRELFQFDFSDLDFGIYKLLHLKRGEVEKFLTVQLPETVKREFKKLAGDEQSALEHEIEELAKRIREVDDEAILENGDLNPQRQKKGLLKTYAEKRQQLHQSQATDEQQADVFNHLHSFFARYYDEGDFIPRPRRGSNHAHYAVPYNGEETFFHWANRDQHYVKTAENFRDYSFAVTGTLHGDYRVRFTLTEASVPKDGTKGDMRWFFPRPDEASYDKAAKVFMLPFHYRLPTEKEVTRQGGGAKGQDALLKQSAPWIVEKVPDAILQNELAKIVEVKNPDEPKKCEEISCLLKRLRHFTKRNTTDYFIHKRLRAFLAEELEFYIKDQIIQLPDLTSDFEPKRRMLRVFKALAEQVIEFLSQVEDVQKRLFEKRKFVLRADYLVPIQHVPRNLWPEIVAEEKQVAAWKDLFGIKPRQDLLNRNGEVNEQFLQEHPTLVVNTEYFEPSFKERLLSLLKLDDLDEATDGLLIHAENYQALRLLERKLSNAVDAIYNDPPYNTGRDFIYKDTYKRSSWVAKMCSLNKILYRLLRPNAALFTSVDDNEYNDLLCLSDMIFGEDAHATIIRVNPSTKSWAEYLSVTHDYCVVNVKPSEQADAPGPWRIRKPYVDEFKKRTKALLKLKLTDEEKRQNLRELVKIPMFKAFDHYTEFDEKGVYRSGNPNRTLQSEGAKVFPHVVLIHPVTKKKCELSDNWRFDQEKTDEIAARTPTGFHFGPDHTTVPGIKNYLEEYEDMTPQSVMFDDTQVDTKTILPGMGLKFDFPKPLSFVRRLVEMSTRERSLVADFYAGSGTTGHAVIDINREDGKQRKFLLVDFAPYYYTTLVPRIQKLMFTPQWKDGLPVRVATETEVARSPRLVKLLRLEGYEDALHNLVTDETLKREASRAKAHKKVDEEKYRLSYMLRLPLEASASLLNLAELEHPFGYQIEVLTEIGPKTETVDLVETFNFLYGLHVERLAMWVNPTDERTYRVVKARSGDGHKQVLVVWRDMAGLDKKAKLEVERKFLEAKLREDSTSYDEKWINGDAVAIHGSQFQSLDGLFKRLMEEPERES